MVEYFNECFKTTRQANVFGQASMARLETSRDGFFDRRIINNTPSFQRNLLLVLAWTIKLL